MFTLAPWETGKQIGAALLVMLYLIEATKQQMNQLELKLYLPWHLGKKGQQIGAALLVMLYLIEATMNVIVARALFVYLGSLGNRKTNWSCSISNALLD